MRHYRIVNPVRFFIFILITVLFITFAGYSLLGGHKTEAQAEAPVRYTKVVIQQDDTLWNIASSYNPEVSDVRELVHEIYDYNGIDANNLQPGDIVYVPVY